MTVISPVLLPAFIAGCIWLGAFRLWNRNAPASHAPWGGALAFGAGYLAGHVALLSLPPVPPTSAEHWLAWIALPIATVCAAERWWGANTAIAWPVRMVCAAIVVWLQSASLREYRWSGLETIAWIGGASLAVAAIWDSMERLGKLRPGLTIPAALWFVTTVASICLVLTGSAMLGQLAGTLSAVLGAGAVLALWAPRLSFHCGAVGAWLLLFTSLVWQGHFYSELGFISAIGLLIAPAFAWCGELPGMRLKKAWARMAARILAVAIPLTIAVALAARFWSAAQGEEYVY